MQLSLFTTEDLRNGWVLWDPPFTLTRKTLDLFCSIFGCQNYDIVEFEDLGDGNFLCKFHVSPEGIRNVDVWIAKVKSVRKFY